MRLGAPSTSPIAPFGVSLPVLSSVLNMVESVSEPALTTACKAAVFTPAIEGVNVMVQSQL
jgi:hypothetical protein